MPQRILLVNENTASLIVIIQEHTQVDLESVQPFAFGNVDALALWHSPSSNGQLLSAGGTMTFGS